MEDEHGAEYGQVFLPDGHHVRVLGEGAHHLAAKGQDGGQHDEAQADVEEHGEAHAGMHAVEATGTDVLSAEGRQGAGEREDDLHDERVDLARRTIGRERVGAEAVDDA